MREIWTVKNKVSQFFFFLLEHQIGRQPSRRQSFPSVYLLSGSEVDVQLNITRSGGITQQNYYSV